MKIGIGLPSTIPRTTPARVLEWAQKADAGPYSAINVIDRIAYPNYDPMTILTAAAAVTKRVRLVTAVVLLPLRQTTLFAKQAATIDALSNGRLTLGLGLGSREDDFIAAEVDIKSRGKRFDQQLETMRRIWSQQPVAGAIIGPTPVQKNGPEILIGGFTEKVASRVARFGNGFIAATGVKHAAKIYGAVDKAWNEAGRPGKPRFVAGSFFALGTEAKTNATAYLSNYYAFGGQPMVDGAVRGILDTPEKIRQTIQAFSDIGVDEFILSPGDNDVSQVERLAEVIKQ